MKYMFFNSYPGAENGIDISRKFNGIYRHCPKGWASNQMKLAREVSEIDVVIIWNALEPCTEWIKKLCYKYHKPWLALEYGFIPQRGHYHLDNKGLISESSLNDNLSWLTSQMIDEAENYFEQFFKKKKWQHKKEGNYILCPLQLPWDTSIYLCSDYHSMDQFIQDVIVNFPKQKIIVTPHPLNKTPQCLSKEIHDQITFINNQSTMELAQNATKIVGITSTVLYEALALGVDTIALGKCPINTHNGNRNVARAAFHRQFHHRDFDKFDRLVHSLLNIT